MAEKKKRPRHTGAQLMEVARAYYLDDLSKVEIAERFELSRWQVARMLDDAKRLGYVQVHIGDPEQSNDPLGRDLAEALGIERAVVAGRSRELGLGPTQDSVAATLAATLSAAVRPGMKVGFAWSRVIEFMPRHLDRLAPCDVVQLGGALSYSGDRLGSVEVIRQVAHIAGGTAYPLYAPLVADDVESAAAFSRQPAIAECLRRAEDVDLAVISVGAWTPEGSAVHSLLAPDEADRIARDGGCGDVSGHVFDTDGNMVVPGLSGRIIGISAERLRGLSDTIATSYGQHRAEATVAAVRAGFVHTLIVDEPLAQAILQLMADQPAG
ncbi:sugar-binding transcriptional regulator [Promicromonospora sp. NPDC050880]|uniref:sugar-binding transcriptional regulator n=1 Tax=Promicromonospora sp. NPDC050880 TaxID=3364406 RepID=UPI0037B9991F